MAVYWHGTRQEASALLHAISSHCSCEPATRDASATRETPPARDAAAAKDARPQRCPPHLMLVEDQRALNGLLFARNILSRLLLEEWDLTATGWATADRRALSTEGTPGAPGPIDLAGQAVVPRTAHA